MSPSRCMTRGRLTPFARAFRQLAAWPFRVAERRAALRQLAGMSERELSDIRLTRQDLRDASALSPREDPWIFASGGDPSCR